MRFGLGAPLVALAVVAAPSVVPAQEAGQRAWQQRLKVEVPAAVPLITLAPANPFATPVSQPPALLTSVPPRKQNVAGRALAALYVDADGRCQGAVPLELPFPGITTSLVDELMDTRFEPAKVGRRDVASWLVLEVTLAATVKESAVLDQTLELPRPDAPPAPPEAQPPFPAGRLASLPFTPRDQLTATASPRRVRVKISGREVETGVRALVHVTDGGRCDRFVPLEVESGLVSWLSAYLASWHLEPAQRDGQPVPTWLHYTARIRLKLSGLDSTTARLFPERTFTPRAATASGSEPAGS